ncbi:hypothetical protein RND71_032750 [Anisodus tanguticus]|uniref:Rapid ALkalinization Factor n=1 Tax=Anisodus tanguticus TaxID=243964 RepID=A0AAE1R6Z0_9SOLA|nr:hypothetical protein RND71_032750 [Anisodus tanguticus]
MGREKCKTLLLLLLTIVSLKTISLAGSSQECNGTSSIGDFLADHGDEFLMESQTSAMLTNNVYKISTGSLQKPPICDEHIYGNCIDSPNLKADRCTFDSRCKRGGINQ